MPWVRLDDHFDEHPKVLAAGPLAGWLHLCGLTYCARNLTDGFVPWAAVPRLVNWEGVGMDASGFDDPPGICNPVDAYTLALQLVDVGLWERVERGFQIHDYLEFQPSRADVHRERDHNKQRQAQWRERHRNGVVTDVSHENNAVSNAPRNGTVTDAPYPVPVPVPEVINPHPEITPSRGTGGVGGDSRTPAGAAPPKARETPKKPSRNLGPLVDAFRELGLADPKFTGAEAKAAADLLALWAPADLATCWQDHASGDYGDDFSRRELSFGYLSVRNRVGNWEAWRQEQAPMEAPVYSNGLTHMPREPGIYPQGVRCSCGHVYSIMAPDCSKCGQAQTALRKVTA